MNKTIVKPSIENHIVKPSIENRIVKPSIENRIRGIAFEGGGITGLAHMGVLKVMGSSGLIEPLTHFAGASAGSIVAGLMACKIPVDRLCKIMLNFDFKILQDSSWFFFRDVYRLVKDFGWNPGLSLETTIENILSSEGISPSITLGEIKLKYGSMLVIPVTDVGLKQTVYFNSEDTPDVKLSSLIRMSCGIPFFFSTIKENDHMYVDGGLLDNYPIMSLYKYIPKEQVIGVKLMTRSEIDSRLRREVNSVPVNILDYAKDIIEMLREQALKLHVHSDDWERTIAVDIGTTSSINFSLDEYAKKNLIASGEVAATVFFLKRK
jgi:NTE family protein